jgi:hypothetical protein
MTLEQRVAALEAKLSALMPNSKTISVENIQARNITLKSAKGESSIIMLTQNTGAGIWITRGTQDGSVALYNMHGQGPVVGVHGPHKNGKARIGMDAAFFYRPDEGAMLQMSDELGKVHQISTADIMSKGNSGLSSYHSILS